MRSSRPIDITGHEIFREDVPGNMKIINEGIAWLDPLDKPVAVSIVSYYEDHGEINLIQERHAVRFWQTINSKR